MKQVRLLIASNAGGSGKTTTALHVAYELARVGKKVTIVELDHNGSISAFTGLTDDLNPDHTHPIYSFCAAVAGSRESVGKFQPEEEAFISS